MTRFFACLVFGALSCSASADPAFVVTSCGWPPSYPGMPRCDEVRPDGSVVHYASTEICKSPNVSRVVTDNRPATMSFAVNHPIVWRLACPLEGSCGYVADPPPRIEQFREVICLTPEQNAAAEALWK